MSEQSHTSLTDKSQYRRDIDGLRALAIIPVVLYHSGTKLFSGGYVGVDVFFVVSGFLIAGIITREIDQDQFSIIRFYQRRALRIMPALMVMIAAVLLLASYYFLPADFAKVPRSAVWTTLFVSNVGFFMETGYFAGGIETMPLLHSWSLSVEEQFYLGFPILLILIARWIPGRRTLVIASIAGLSFAIAVITQNSSSGFAFYLLPPRAWELFIGALLAIAPLPVLKSKPLKESVALAGLMAIIFSSVSFSKNTVFPGVNAIFPVLGAAALIYSAPNTWTGRLLSVRPLVGIGIISYSLYLWHWPIIVFTEYVTEKPLFGFYSLAAITASFGAAYLSWRFIEQPFRGHSKFSQNKVFVWTGGAMTVACLLSAAMMMTNGWPSRFDAETLRLDAASNDISPARTDCVTLQIGGLRPRCNLGANVTPQTIIWADSHGVEIAWALSEKLRSKNAALIQRTRASCPPIIGYKAKPDTGCALFNKDVMQTIVQNKNLKNVVLAGYWTHEAYGKEAKALDYTIRTLIAQRRRVILVGSIPSQNYNVPRHLAAIARNPSNASGYSIAGAGILKSDYTKQIIWMQPYMQSWRDMGVIIVDPAAFMCPKDICLMADNGVPLYFDKHHPSLSGARKIIDLFPEI